MTRLEIPVAQLEFDEGGHTLWVHGPNGATVLRVKCTGKITSKVCNTNISAHADLMVEGDIEICLPPEEQVKTEWQAECPKCNAVFKWEDDKEDPPDYGVFCAACKGPLKGILHFDKVKV